MKPLMLAITLALAACDSTSTTEPIAVQQARVCRCRTPHDSLIVRIDSSTIQPMPVM